MHACGMVGHARTRLANVIPLTAGAWSGETLLVARHAQKRPVWPWGTHEKSGAHCTVKMCQPVHKVAALVSPVSDHRLASLLLTAPGAFCLGSYADPSKGVSCLLAITAVSQRAQRTTAHRRWHCTPPPRHHHQILQILQISYI